jgi:CRISPR system Cascade subunit CasD
MSTVLLRLQGPMQSWGTTSRFDERDTQLEPSKSGVLGLVCAALGRDRSEPVDDLASLRMGVRVDREGVPMRDYQTATGVVIASSGKPDLGRTVVSPRYYLSDAAFLVGLEGPDEIVHQIQAALRSPVWPLALGRKSFVPSSPICFSDGVVSVSLEQAFLQWPPLVNLESGSPVRCLLESANEGSVRLDQPVAPYASRRFGPRYVKSKPLIVGAEHASQPFIA